MIANTQKQGTASAEIRNSLHDFFIGGNLLTMACREIGLDYDAIRYSLRKSTGGIQTHHLVLLMKWQEMWIEQEEIRKALAEDYKLLAGADNV